MPQGNLKQAVVDRFKAIVIRTENSPRAKRAGACPVQPG